MSWTKENTDTLIRLRFDRRKWAEISEMIEGTTPVSCSNKYRRIPKEDRIPKVAEVECENILIIPDPHAPFVKSGYLEFCKSIYDKYNCNKVIFTGDLVDNHFSSFHEADPDGYSAGDELKIAIDCIAKFYEVFPEADVCIGNHDRIVNRKAFSAGVSKLWIKEYKDVLNTPNWVFKEEFVYNGVLYTHGEGRKARQRCMQEFISVCQGHYHSDTYYETFVSEHKLLFAMQLGCVDGETEFLSPFGWKKISEYTLGDKVCQYDTNTNISNFVYPSKYIKEHCDYMYYMHNSYGLSQKLSGDHNVLYRDRNKKFGKVKMADLYITQYTKSNGFEKGLPCTYNLNTESKICLTDDEIRVMVMFHADGSLRSDMNMHGRVTFKKKRKIDRCEHLLKSANIEYRHMKYKDGSERFVFEPPITTKSYDISWYGVSESQMRVIAEECFFWDGDMSKRYHSKHKSDCDFIQFVLNGIGFRTHIEYDKRVGKNCYSVTISTTKKDRHISNHGKCNIDIIKSSDGFKYCFTVSSGNIVLRHNDSIFVTGNCGIDRRSFAMAYGKHFKKPQINCGVVLDNGRYGIIEHMKLGE